MRNPYFPASPPKSSNAILTPSSNPPTRPLRLGNSRLRPRLLHRPRRARLRGHGPRRHGEGSGRPGRKGAQDEAVGRRERRAGMCSSTPNVPTSNYLITGGKEQEGHGRPVRLMTDGL